MSTEFKITGLFPGSFFQPPAKPEPLHCPFCGGPATHTLGNPETNIVESVECTDCHARVECECEPWAALNAWNLRPPGLRFAEPKTAAPIVELPIEATLEEEPLSIEEKAANWDALMATARIRVLGSAGLDDTESDYHHIGLELWSTHPAKTTEHAKKWFLKYVAAMRRLVDKQPTI